MPSETLQLYTPMTLQSMPHSSHSHHHHHSDYAPVLRHNHFGVPPARSHHQVGGGGGNTHNLDYAQNRNLGLYSSGHGGGATTTSASHSQSSQHFSNLPLSAPPSMPNNPFSAQQQQQQQSHSPAPQGMYTGFTSGSPRLPPAQPESQQQQQPYFGDGTHSHPGSAPGSGYGTPQ